jgi:phage major head subunit gpT-like protein
MIINAENLQALEQTIITAWKEGLNSVPTLDLSFMTTPFPSTGAMNLYPFIEDLGQWREWLGERVWNNLKASKFQVTNRDFEKSYKLPKKDIDDDQYAVFPSMVQLAAAGWPHLKNTIRMDVITGNAETFTGKALLADDHAYGDNTIDNLVADALSQNSFEAAFLAASSWKFANNLPTSTRFTHLLVGEKLRGTALELVADKTTTGGFNRNAGRVQVLVVDEFSGSYDDYWLLADNSKPLKPLLLQTRQEAEITVLSAPEFVKEHNEIKVMADGRLAAAPTFPHLVYGGRL